MDLREYGIYSFIIPSLFPTGDTRCFLAEGKRGWAIIDTGLNYPAAREQWEIVLKTIGISFRQIEEIYLTHNHPDHYGLAGWIQQKSDAQVFLLRQDIWHLEKYKLPEKEQIALVKEEMALHGIPEDIIIRMVKDVVMINELFKPYAEITPLDEGDTFQFGNDTYTVYSIPGHTDGHAAFLGQKHKLLFSGDAFLADRVSQISDWPYSSVDNHLALSLQTLHKIAEQKPQLILPAHGELFQDAQKRLLAIEKFHTHRLDKITKLLTHPMNLYELCQKVNVKARVLQELRVSWADTRAYLEYLKEQGEIIKKKEKTIVYIPK